MPLKIREPFAMRKKLIPVVDMKNYQTIYNEKKIFKAKISPLPFI